MRSFAMSIYSGDVVSKDVLKSFHNLLQGGDGTSAITFVEIRCSLGVKRWQCRTVKVVK